MDKLHISIRSLCLLIALVTTFTCWAQFTTTITGVVKDTSGEPLIGVNVLLVGENVGTITDFKGMFMIQVNDVSSSSLRFSYIGYEIKDVLLKGRKTLSVTLNESTQLIDDIVVVGYGIQKKVTLTGAINSVTSKDIKTATTSNVQNMLTGKLPGVRVQQRTGEPGDYSTNLDIRGLGAPLVVIDGVIREQATFQRMDANEIESITVLKDASAAIYGMRASNGVVLITTKKGDSEQTRVEFTTTTGFQNPSGLPDVLNAGQYAELVREADKNMGRGASGTFTLDEMTRLYQEGGTDWYSIAMKKFVPQTQHNLTVSGSTDRSNYFVSFGYYGESGIWKSNDLDYQRYNLRSNIGFEITNNLKAELLISGMMDEKNQPYRDTWEQFKLLWALRPTQTPYANNNENFLQDVLYGLNPYAVQFSDISGYKQLENKTFNGTFTLNYNLPYVKGLSSKFLYSYDYRIQQGREFKKAYTLYNYDSQTGNYKPMEYQSPSSMRRSHWDGGQNLLQASVSYNNSFSQKHNLNLLMLYEHSSRYEDNFWAGRIFEMDAVDELFAGSEVEQIGTSNANNIWKVTNMGFVGRANYDYLSKYMVELSFRYDGSSKFAKGHRWGFFPAASVGYRISEESFIKNTEVLSFITNWKLRSSYGVMGDDGSAGYQFLSGYDYPGSNYVFGDEASKGLGFRGLPNPLITWYTSKMLNIGTNIDLWNGLIFSEVDFFWRYREGLLGRRVGEVPGTVGATLPEENLNEDLYKGFEFVLGHRNKINDFSYSISANFALTRRLNRRLQEGDAVNSYDYYRGRYSYRYADMGWTLGSNGQFTSMEDIWNSPIQDGKGGSFQLPGDWKFEDWNEDGIIDEMDKYPNSYEHTDDKGNPKITFGSTITANWRGLDLNVLLQGGAGFNVIYFEQLQYPLCFDGNGLAHFYDRYHQDEIGNWIPGKWPTTRDPASFGPNYQRAKQTTYDASYLRIKSIELGYSIPSKVTDFLKIDRFRIFLNGFNLYTFSNLDFVDPEHPEGSYGYLYPIMRNFNFGVNLMF